MNEDEDIEYIDVTNKTFSEIAKISEEAEKEGLKTYIKVRNNKTLLVLEVDKNE